MKSKRLLVKCIAIPLVVGGLSAFLTGGGMSKFASLAKPPLSPPGWLFPVVWTILYVMMGVASYLVLTSDGTMEEKEKALSLYGYQLTVNFLWPVFFFSFEWYLFAFFWLVLLWILIGKTRRAFRPLSKVAAWLLIPYQIWVTFAGYLNLGIWWLNTK